MSANSENNGYEEYEEYLNHLQEAERALSGAMDDLYLPGGIKRGLGYRLRVARAQSTVMTLLVRELSQKEGKGNGGMHEWEHIEDDLWECIYCERRTSPTKLGKRLFFKPNVLRHVPIYGRKWRCSG